MVTFVPGARLPAKFLWVPQGPCYATFHSIESLNARDAYVLELIPVDERINSSGSCKQKKFAAQLVNYGGTWENLWYRKQHGGSSV